MFHPPALSQPHPQQEAYILNLSPWRNLIFGCANPNSVDPERIRMILNMLWLRLVKQRRSRGRYRGRFLGGEWNGKPWIFSSAGFSLDVQALG